MRVTIVATGTTHPSVVKSDGDYAQWFEDRLGVPCDVVAVHAGHPLPDARSVEALLLTGSPLSVRDELPWMPRLAEWTLGIAEGGVHVLAVCFGHQLVGEALGGRVDRNPNGPEYGTIEVALTEAGRNDPLFRGLPPTVAFQATHRDALVVPPAGVTHLAGNANTPWQAFSHGTLRAVQFHPELRPDTARKLFEARGVAANVRDADSGLALLENWTAALGGS